MTVSATATSPEDSEFTARGEVNLDLDNVGRWGTGTGAALAPLLGLLYLCLRALRVDNLRWWRG